MRERDLQAAIGIAKLLLDNTITLKNTNEDLQQEIEDLESQLRTTKQEMKYLKESLMMTEEQFDRASSDLRGAEEQISTLTQERDYYKAENEKLAKKSSHNEVVVTKTVEDDSLKKRSNRLESKNRIGICD
jgi:chromosome segregation ATPase